MSRTSTIEKTRKAYYSELEYHGKAPHETGTVLNIRPF